MPHALKHAQAYHMPDKVCVFIKRTDDGAVVGLAVSEDEKTRMAALWATAPAAAR